MARGRRTPTILQLEAAECGAASLAMVLGHHGRFVPLEQLRTLCGVSRDGAKASSLLRAARSFGFEAKGLKAEPHHLADLHFPLIAFVNFNHFVVIERVTEAWVWINDPAYGRRRDPLEEFAEGFTGVVLTFVPGPGFVRSDTRPNILPSILSRFAGVERALFYVALTSIALVVPGILLPVFSRIFVDFVLIRGTSDWLLPLLAGMALTAIVRFVLIELRQEVLLRAGVRMRMTTGTALFEKLMALPIAFFDQRFAGEVADRLRLNEELVGMLTGQAASVGASIVTAVFFLAVMLLYSVPLTVLILLLVGANVAALFASNRLLADRYRKVSIDLGKLMGARIASLKDIETFKASGAEDMVFARWLGLSVNVENGRQRMAALSHALSALPALIGALTTAVVLVGGAIEVMRGVLTLGGLVAFQTLAASFTAPAMELVGLGQQLQEIRSYTGRIDDILDQADDVACAATPSAVTGAMPRGKIEIRSLSFGYAPLDPPLIDDFSLTLPPGARVALAGASGSGKSTLGKLIAGLMQPSGGSILIDGRAPLDWPREMLAARLAYVRQEVALFEGSIRDNLSLWDETIAEADLVAAAQDAQIHATIAARPGAYGAALAEGGGNFSGGERQRLEIARALATNPSIIVLDEATSALDPVTELAVMEAIRRRGVTCIIIAHRLSAIRECDEIIVLDRGRIVERGTHQALAAAAGSYARLVEA